MQPENEGKRETRPRKNNQVNYNAGEGSEEDDNTSLYSRGENGRTKKGKGLRGKATNPYPTKNFLANFKGPHIQFLRHKLGFDYVNSFEIVDKIWSKNGISMKDY